MWGVMNAPEFDSSNLTRLQSQLTTWRNDRRGRPRLPESFWWAATAQARIHGVSGVSRSLRIGYHKLRRLAAEDHSLHSIGPKVNGSASTRPFPFVEIQLPTHPPALMAPEASKGAVEFSDSSQRKLRIEIPTDSDLCLRLMEAFWRSAS